MKQATQQRSACTRRRRRIVAQALITLLYFTLFIAAARSQQPKIVAFYTEHTERDHVDFAHQAIEFFTSHAASSYYEFSATTDWAALNEASLQGVAAVLWLNDQPHTEPQRRAFEQYMMHGGGWMGFHAAGYNDSSTHWPWFVDFLGGAVFNTNNWPPLPAKLIVEDRTLPVTRGLPNSFQAPANEWYGWQPNPRSNPNVRVLMSLSPENFPLGLKDTLTSGDIPVVWTNTRFHMLYVNMGHGNQIFTDEVQNRFFLQALQWIVGQPVPTPPRSKP